MTINHFATCAFLSICLALLSGCTTRPAQAPLPDLSALPTAEARTQRLTFDHDGQRHQLLGVLRHDNRELQLALLSPQGQRLLTLVQDAQGARFRPGAAIEAPFTAEWLANRLAWSLWPSPALERAFADSGWTLREDAEARIVAYRGRPMARITGSPECRIIEDIEGGYRLQIASLGDDTDRTDAACPSN